MKISRLFFNFVFITAFLPLVGCVANQSLDNISVAKKGMEKKAFPLPAIQIVQEANQLRVIAYSDICFRSNGKLSANCAHQLNQTIKLIKSYGNGLIQVVGYSDDLYDPQTAYAVTKDQAEVITSFLWSHGIGSQRLRTIGAGRHDFIASNRNIRASSFNRRVEIILVKN